MDTPTNPKIDLDDVSNDAEHLFHLLDCILDLELGGRDLERSLRAQALTWIARDLAKKVSSELLDIVDPKPQRQSDEAEAA